jgi:hypothetical protein
MIKVAGARFPVFGTRFFAGALSGAYWNCAGAVCQHADFFPGFVLDSSVLLYDEVLRIPLGELPQPRPPRLLDQLRLVLRVRHYSRRTDLRHDSASLQPARVNASTDT